jgi:hypothetical protein
MPDGGEPYESSSKRLQELLLLQRQAQRDAALRNITERGAVVTAIRERLAVKALENLIPLLDAFIEGNLPTKAQNTHSGERRTAQESLFDLDEFFAIRYRDEQFIKRRAKLAIEDGDQISKQKAGNIVSAQRAKQLWDWEWSFIRPLLVSNSGWLYEDAYNYLLARGGLPTPPDFDK